MVGSPNDELSLERYQERMEELREEWIQYGHAEGYREGLRGGLERVLGLEEHRYGPTEDVVIYRHEIGALLTCVERTGVLPKEAAKCPRCGEPDSGLFSGSSCDSCGWKNWNPEPDDG